MRFLSIATDDERIRAACADFGAPVVMTRPDHKSGTDRLIEVAIQMPDYDVIVNVQGDEPGIEAELIDGVARLKREHPEWSMTTAARPFRENEDALSPNRVKVTISHGQRALYFSRSLIPFPRKETKDAYYLHLGIYAYQRDFLLRYNHLPASVLEESESLEQLRALENDHHIGVYVTRNSMPSVDTPADLQSVIELFRASGRL